MSKRMLQLLMLFEKSLNDSKGYKPKKIWADKGSDFYSRSIKSWLKDNDIEIYSTHNQRKSVVTKYIHMWLMVLSSYHEFL